MKFLIFLLFAFNISIMAIFTKNYEYLNNNSWVLNSYFNYKEPENSHLFQILKKMDEKILNSRYFKFLAWSVLIKAKKS